MIKSIPLSAGAVTLTKWGPDPSKAAVPHKYRRIIMNKTELAAAVAENTGLTKKASEEAVDAALNAIIEELKGGNKVQLVGFGSFEVRERAAREGRNPQNGEKIDIAASRSVSFKAGKALKDALAE